jgi:radical SAM superfamily enzyme YgiQ (UPF0313 family)
MKVLLINTPIWKETGFQSNYNPGMGLLYIGAVLREKGCEVRIIDAEAMKWWTEDILSEISIWNPSHIGISCLSNGFDIAISLVLNIKLKYPNIWVCLGGVGPSCEPERAFHESGADSICVGEGELIVDKVFSEKGIHYGISPEDLDALPMPAYDLMEPTIGGPKWMGNLPRPEINGPIKETVVMWSRGCPHACTFCSKATIPRKYPRLRSPKNIVKELQMLRDKFGINSVFVYDDELIGMGDKHNEWLIDVLTEIYGSDMDSVYFKGQGRCSEKFINDKVCKNLVDAGFFAMMMGCESGSDEVKRAIKKGTTNEDIRHTLKLLRDNGVKVYGFWMIGIPTETRDEAKKTEKLIEELSPYMDWIQITIFSPLPGSDFWKTAIDNGYLKDYRAAANFQTDSVLDMPWMTKDEILKWQHKLYFVYEYSRKNNVISN